MKNKFLTTLLLVAALLCCLPLRADNPLPGVQCWIGDKVHRGGVAAFLDIFFRNTSDKTVKIYLDANPFEDHRNVIIDGDCYSLDSGGGSDLTIPPGETAKTTLYVDRVPYNAKELSMVTVKGSSNLDLKGNPYGRFTYDCSHIKLPSYPDSNKAKCWFLDTEFGMTIDKVAPNGRDLEITYTLTNNGKRNKRIVSSELGKATDEDGDEYAIKDSHRYDSYILDSGDSARGKMIIEGGANRLFNKIRIVFDICEIGGNNFNYPVLMQVDGAQAE